MAVKSYLDKMTTINWGKRSENEVAMLWGEFEASIIMGRIDQYPPQHQQVIFDEVIKGLKGKSLLEACELSFDFAK